MSSQRLMLLARRLRFENHQFQQQEHLAMMNPASQVAVGPFEGRFWLALRQAAPD